jgi:hypothetical protein
MKKIILATATSAILNCLVGHLISWCMFEAMGMDCPCRRS